MRKLLLSSYLILLISFVTEAQRRYGLIDKRNASTGTIIFSLGPEFCFTDTKATPYTQNILKNKDLSIGFRVRYPNNFGYKTQINYTDITGSDGSSNSRNYSFSSKIWQMSIQGEYTINFGESYRQLSPPHSIYFFLGVGLLNSTADLNYDKRARYLYKTSHDNQYDINKIFPLGFGYQYNFYNNFLVGIEYNIKYTTSDYIDGFKPPYPESKSNDIFEGLSLTVGYKIF